MIARKLAYIGLCLEIIENFFSGIPRPDEMHVFKESRHFLLTNKDYTYLESFVEYYEGTGIIAAPWHVYGRDEKIENVLEYLNSSIA